MTTIDRRPEFEHLLGKKVVVRWTTYLMQFPGPRWWRRFRHRLAWKHVNDDEGTRLIGRRGLHWIARLPPGPAKTTPITNFRRGVLTGLEPDTVMAEVLDESPEEWIAVMIDHDSVTFLGEETIIEESRD